MIRRPPRSTLFPSRRSSDLACAGQRRCRSTARTRSESATRESLLASRRERRGPPAAGSASARHRRSVAARSEEHTSELQSRLHLVCRLLLEKKKNKKTSQLL